jgi:hypothetical protein
MRMLYKYPHAAFPYSDLVQENARRGLNDPEYEVLDTGVFNDNHYFDVSIEYAKHTPDDIFMRVTVTNRSDQPARLHVLPQLWARDIWSMGAEHQRPSLSLQDDYVLSKLKSAPLHGGNRSKLASGCSVTTAPIPRGFSISLRRGPSRMGSMTGWSQAMSWRSAGTRGPRSLLIFYWS